jgi:hypothetical protein
MPESGQYKRAPRVFSSEMAGILAAALWPIADEPSDPGFQLSVEVGRVFPHYVRILPGVEVKIVHRGFLACPNDWNVEAHGESSFEIDPASYLVRLACEVSDQEARTANFGNDLVVHFVEVMVLLVHPPRFISTVFDGLVESVDVRLLGRVVEPHCDECLSRIDGGLLQFFVFRPALWSEREERFLGHSEQVHVGHHLEKELGLSYVGALREC